MEADMAKEYAKLCACLQEIDVFKVVLVDNCKTEFEKVIDKHIRMKSRHQEFFMSMTRGVVSYFYRYFWRQSFEKSVSNLF